MQPPAGGVQKSQPSCGIRSLLLQLDLPDGEIVVNLFPVFATGKDFANQGQTEAKILQGSDSTDNGQLILTVVTIAGMRINGGRREQVDFIVMAQHANADSGQL